MYRISILMGLALFLSGSPGQQDLSVWGQEQYVARAGDLILTRNRNDFGNQTPGYWNHVGIVSSQSLSVIESQREFNGLIETKIKFFLQRYPEYLILRKQNQETARSAAVIAKNSRNRSSSSEYGSWASLRFNLSEVGNKDNCVSFVRRCYYSASGIDYRWKTPDQIYQHRQKNGFEIVFHHKNYDDWTPPENIWEGKIE